MATPRLSEGFAAHGAAAGAEADALAKCLDAPLDWPGATRFLFSQEGALSSAATAARIAAGLTRPLDFAALVQRAHDEGARLFVELGPGSTCTRWVVDTLKAGRRAHLAAPVTRRGVGEALSHAQLAAALVAHRWPLDFARLLRRPLAPPPQSMRIAPGGPSVLAALRKAKHEPGRHAASGPGSGRHGGRPCVRPCPTAAAGDRIEHAERPGTRRGPSGAGPYRLSSP